ncbi:aminotransferase class I/II-fold pyridoxal phosphate-dependent enzyme [Brenneria izadpanahii]|uniref:Aminotransferase class I/II-fold pyridoxal phosphate-dependent enzyme n=1 Tax=Brenneria izadpanahii TaxID=2722756 RepID=A0ABX7UMN0_9GAMM|nr:aminotransferase class I/II-fold pyridoxal phosphate-dependent enzyme [Brenneria izadpanahii]QTF06823.1 aminotransferase class I/II-fold pyridoxal phosphate-dependent enzyme [Brenneria izadpanahii]
MPWFVPARRVGQLTENLFSRLENQARLMNDETRPLIDLSKGSPDGLPPPEVIERLHSAIGEPANHAYPPFLGKRSTRLAVANFYQREYGVELDPDTEVCLFQGSHIGIIGIPQAIVNPGETIITTDPCYPMYRSAATLAQARLYTIAVDERRGFLPDYRQVPADIARQAALLMLNYPNNPTGAVASRAFFEQTLAFARHHRLAILHDFAYAELGRRVGERPLSLLQTPGAKEYAVETYTLSKTFNMAGWRLGFAVGNASIIQAFNKLHTNSYSTIFGAIQDAAETALSLPRERIDEIGAVYHRRRRILTEGLRNIGWPSPAAQGTFFVWLPVPEGYDSLTFANLLLERAQVLAAPGEGFGPAGRGFIRLSLTSHQDRLTEAVARLGQLALF